MINTEKSRTVSSPIEGKDRGISYENTASRETSSGVQGEEPGQQRRRNTSIWNRMNNYEAREDQSEIKYELIKIYWVEKVLELLYRNNLTSVVVLRDKVYDQDKKESEERTGEEDKMQEGETGKNTSIALNQEHLQLILLMSTLN